MGAGFGFKSTQNSFIDAFEIEIGIKSNKLTTMYALFRDTTANARIVGDVQIVFAEKRVYVGDIFGFYLGFHKTKSRETSSGILTEQLTFNSVVDILRAGGAVLDCVLVLLPYGCPFRIT